MDIELFQVDAIDPKENYRRYAHVQTLNLRLHLITYLSLTKLSSLRTHRLSGSWNSDYFFLHSRISAFIINTFQGGGDNSSGSSCHDAFLISDKT
ncbi:hypothetical protein DERP_013608 [Dermatophagoides pteronyssinus]|uniref:Uncharacterized protein n=1 Tax=Dermatophagoides pteronyssinus TaxID=6956 RepID=A0ABQ8IQ62_DERPT|nr:hypothetical protein DERP_013608 [Dermatophagoides pteronyssinus]